MSFFNSVDLLFYGFICPTFILKGTVMPVLAENFKIQKSNQNKQCSTSEEFLDFFLLTK